MPERGGPSPPARVPYIFPAEGTNEAADVIRERRGARGLIDLDGVLMNAEPIALGWNELAGAIRTKTTLPADQMELLILRVAMLNGSTYVWRAHAPLGLTAGLTPSDLHAIRTVPPFSASSTSTALSPICAALLDYADQMTRNVLVPEPTFSRLSELLGDDNRKIVEVTTTVAGYNFSTRVLRALDVARLGEVEVPVPELH